MLNQKIHIQSRAIGQDEPCLVIAEAGVNHFGNLNKAYELVDMAVEAGADVFKIQHFKTDLLVNEKASDWRERLRSKELADDDVLKIQERCSDKNIIFMCTAHDEYSLDFLDNVANVPAFKIGSGEVDNWPFLQDIASRNKPVILSTGMYSFDKIQEVIELFESNGCKNLGILHCITSYPTPPSLVNLHVMDAIKSCFQGPVGYSDHTVGTAVPLAAVALGAKIIEKHITIDKNIPNAQDWKVSCDPSNFAQFVSDIRDIEESLGDGVKVISEKEEESLLWARKSLVAVRDINVNDTFSIDNIGFQRPGDGLPPSRISEFLGRKSSETISAGTFLNLDMCT